MKQLWKPLIATCLLLVSTITHAGWTVRYQHTDTLGSVIAQSNDQGTISQRFDYKPFGEGTPTQKSGLGYTGHLEDTDLGLTYMQQRYYDPVVGRFYSNDPVGYNSSNVSMSFNRFLYVNNNPLRYVDPFGMVMSCATENGVYRCISTQERPPKNQTNSLKFQIISMIARHEMSQNILGSNNSKHTCIGSARVLGGNQGTIGKKGGFSGDTVGNLPVLANSIAIDNSQWTGDKAETRAILNQVSGSTFGGQSFSGISDIIGSSDVNNVREMLRSRNAGSLSLELVSGRDEGTTAVSILVPNTIECPAGTARY